MQIDIFVEFALVV